MLFRSGVFVMWQARTLDLVFEYGPGPGFFPLWLGIGLTTLAAALVVMAFRGTEKEREAEAGSGRQVSRALTTWGGVIGAVALFGWLGFVVSFGLLTLFLVFVMERRPFFIALTVAVTVTAGFFLLFGVALRVPLPVGPWGF